MTKNRYVFAPAPVTRSKYSKDVVDEWTTPSKEAVPEKIPGLDLGAEMEDKPLMGGQNPEDFPKLMIPKRRNCCMRVICLVCCCNTRDIGVLANTKMTE